MKIAVIIPHKNTGGRIARCLQSLTAQPEIAGAQFEFITIDDNQDTTAELDIANEFAETDLRIIPLLNEGWAGVSGARNTGINWALKRGADYITFLDADDTWTADGAAQIAAAINAHPAAMIIELDHLRHYVETGITKKKYAVPAGTYRFGVHNRAWCFVHNKIYSATLIKAAGLHFQNGLQYGEDEIFNIDALAAHNQIEHDDQHIATVRWFDNKQSLSHIKDRAGLLAQSDALIDCLHRHADKPEIAANICMLIGEHWQSPTYAKAFAWGTL